MRLNLAAQPWYLKAALAFALFLPLLYMLRLDTDSIAAVFGVYWDDEGVYLLSAKNQILFGAAHFFPGDLWKPELIAPLLHRVALLFMTASEPAVSIRLAIALHVIAAAALIGWVAAKHHQNPLSGILCFIVILLNPIVYFYGRIGLSEGVQFLLLAIIITTLFYFYHAATAKRALWLSAALGLLLGALAVSKISAVPACTGMGIAIFLFIWHQKTLPKRWLALALIAICGLAAIAFYFQFIVGSAFDDWWRVNIATNVSRRAPHNIWTALGGFRVRLSDIAYYFCLMPIYVLYFLCLILSADKKKGFQCFLATMTMGIMLVEALFGGDMRRNFFGMAMLSVIGGFGVLDYVKYGLKLDRGPHSFAKALAIWILVMHLWGICMLFGLMVMHTNVVNIAFCSALLLLFAIALASSGEAFTRVRLSLLALFALCSLTPMLFQVLLAPRTYADASLEIEATVPEDGIILGAITPWTFQSLKRRMILTNCEWISAIVDYGTPIDEVPFIKNTSFNKNIFFVSDYQNKDFDTCAPKEIDRYRLLGRLQAFHPQNLGGWQGPDASWFYRKVYTVYAK